jgi:hypothetical protein
MKDIKIDRVEIRLKGISPQMARSSISGLGHELLEKLAEEHTLFKQRRSVNINKIDSGTFQTSGHTGSSDLREMIVNRIVESITSKVYRKRD